MKKILMIISLLSAVGLTAQIKVKQNINDSVLVEQYCDVVSTERFMSNKVTINIDFGEERSIWKDNRLKDRAGKLVKFNTVIDALNDLGKDGWKLVNAFPVGNSANSSAVYHYVFKKEFYRKDAD
jgi:hypothetical protein